MTHPLFVVFVGLIDTEDSGGRVTKELLRGLQQTRIITVFKEDGDSGWEKKSAVGCGCRSIIVALSFAVFVAAPDLSVVSTGVDSAAAVVGR